MLNPFIKRFQHINIIFYFTVFFIYNIISKSLKGFSNRVSIIYSII